MRAVKPAMDDDSTDIRTTGNGLHDTDTSTTACVRQTSSTPPARTRWGCVVFPWLMLESLYHLGIYLHKLSQDSMAVETYYRERHLLFCAISVISLFIPATMYVLYLVAKVMTNSKKSASEICTSIIQGLLIIPWQIKEHVEVLHFSVQRVCKGRAPSKEEKEQVSTLKREAFVLEFFEDFFAGFIQLLLQIYLFLFFITSDDQSSLTLTGEIVGSTLCFLSFIKAIQRKDDGPLSMVLSYLGWPCVAASRILSLSVLASVIHGWVVLACLAHAVLFTLWICSIVFEVHKTHDQLTHPEKTHRNKPFIVLLIFALFGLPSLTYWPIMFEFKKRKRIFIFLSILIVENATCIVVWYLYKSTETSHISRHQLLVAALALTGAGVFFISVYAWCKPTKTDLVVLCNIEEADKENRYSPNMYGIYFDFCKAIMILPETKDIARDLKKLRQNNLV